MFVHISDQALSRINSDNTALEKIISTLILRRAYGVKKLVSQGEDALFAQNTKPFIFIKFRILK